MSKTINTTSRRNFLKNTAAFAGIPLFSSAFVACGGADNDNYLINLTATQAVSLIANGSISAENYVRTLLARANQLSYLNSFISLNTEKAIASAKEVDAKRKAGILLGPLAGLPIAVKDNINTVDLPTTGGTTALRNLCPTTNAPVLQRLIDAGAIVLGKANMHELAFGTTSTNLTSFAGPVKNPYDINRVPGGSSGGTGAAVGARIAPAGIGSDTGGSVRIPAALCGIAGLRPTVGNGGAERRYDGSGVLPISHTRDTVGPMGRTVSDIALLDAVMSGKSIPTAATLSGLRIGVPASFWIGSDNEIISVLNQARNTLTKLGVAFVDVDMPDIWALDNDVSFTLVLHECGPDIKNYLAATGAAGITLTDIRAGIASPDVQAAFDGVLADPYASAYDNVINVLRPRMQAVYADYFSKNKLDAMFFPTTCIQAPFIDSTKGSGTVSINGGTPVETFPIMIRNSDPGSNTGVPGLSIPCGLTAAGMPVGLSLDGPMQSDSRLLAIGMAMESALGLMSAPKI